MGICGPSDQDGRWASTRMVHESQKWLRAVHVALSRGYPLLGSEEALGERAPLSIPGGLQGGLCGKALLWATQVWYPVAAQRGREQV